MIFIDKPYVNEKGGRILLSSHIKNEGEGIENDLYYSVEPDYKKYLCYEQADAFVIAMLLRAIVSGQDILVDSPISEKLYHNLTNGLIYALTKAAIKTPLHFIKGWNPKYEEDSEGRKKYITITCKGYADTKYGGIAVGTGCSLGVDSFSVIKKYLLSEDCLPNYKITHFTCFNVGAFGLYNTEGMRKSFYDEVEVIKDFASKLSIPVVSVDSNIRVFYPERNFNWSHTYLNMSCVLALQKLWGKYLYASGYPADSLELNIADAAHDEPYLLPNISTESTELIEADMEKSRSDKVRYIMDEQVVRQNLNVCLKNQYKNDGKIVSEDDNGHINCGHCEKCLRTMLQLDIFGKLHDFADVFNLSRWEECKQKYLIKVLTGLDNNIMYSDIASTITDQYLLSLKVKRNLKDYKYRAKLRKILSKIIHFFD